MYLWLVAKSSAKGLPTPGAYLLSKMFMALTVSMPANHSSRVAGPFMSASPVK
jgi:hypothetical protein